MAELKPCPFCGVMLTDGRGILGMRSEHIDKEKFVYEHPKTGCVLDYKRLRIYSDPGIVDAWNRRVSDGAES